MQNTAHAADLKNAIAHQRIIVLGRTGSVELHELNAMRALTFWPDTALHMRACLHVLPLCLLVWLLRMETIGCFSMGAFEAERY